MMSDAIDYELKGNDLQLVEIELDQNESVRAETGAMCYMDDGIEMQTGTGGGLLKGLQRVISGESFFITSFTNKSPHGKRRVAFAAPFPGQIIPMNLSETGGEILCQKDAYLCSAAGIEISVAFTKRFGAGLFGGEGFILQKLSGDGLAFVHAGGTLIKRRLDSGERLKVDTGCIVAMETGVDYDIGFVGGFKNAMFGGEGLFLAELTGPGTVYLQSLPFSRLADRIANAAGFTSGNRGETKRGGDLFGSILGGR